VYDKRDIARIQDQDSCSRTNIIVTTQKDAVKIEGMLDLFDESLTVLSLDVGLQFIEGKEKIFERIHGDKNRPALTNKNAFDEIKHVLEQRKANYELAKDFEIDTSIESVQESAERIVGKVKGLGK